MFYSVVITPENQTMSTSSTPPSSPQKPEQVGPATPGTAQNAPPTTAYSGSNTSFEDPTGVWTRFLSASGTPASPQDVHMFLSTLLKFFSKVILTQNEQAAKRSAQKLKDAMEGRDD